MRVRFTMILGLVAMAAAVLMAPMPAQAVPAVIDPNHQIAAEGYNARGDLSTIYMNRNQLMLRITGCEYAARVTNEQNDWTDGFCDDGGGDDPRHWRGSGMGFIEDIVNTQLLAAEADVSSTKTWGGAAYDHLDNIEPVFRNYVDLVLKRLLDADTLTAIDYDPATFRMVDSFNRSTTVPSGLDCISGMASPVSWDTNCDGVSGGWEFDSLSSMLGLGCIAVPILGDLCLNVYAINVTRTVPFAPIAPTYNTAVDPMSAGSLVNNIAAPMVSFDSFDVNNQLTTSHMFLASQPNRGRTFDAELAGCTQAEADTTPGSCNSNPVRDDDDGMYLELALTNFELGLLFEPPFTATAMGVSDETANLINSGVGNDHRHSAARNITDIPETASSVQTYPCPDGTAISVTDESSTDYDPACDLSAYLKATGVAEVPLVRIGASVRIVSNYNYFSPLDTGLNAVTGYTITLGLELQDLQFDAQFQYVFWAGPYCDSQMNAAPDNQGPGQDGTGIFYDRTANPNNCQTLASGASTPSVFDDVAYLTSEQFTETISWVRAEVSGRFQDLFDPDQNPGWFLGPTQLFDLSSFLESPLLDHPIAATDPMWVTDNVYMQLMLDSSVDAPSMITDMRDASGLNYYGELNAADGPINGDSADEFWADPWGVLVPLNASLGLYWTDDSPAQVEMNSCVKNDPTLTGYNDGYVSTPGDAASTADDPYVSRAIPRMNMNWTGSPKANWPGVADPTVGQPAASYDSMLLNIKIPNANGQPPFVSPADIQADFASGGTTPVIPAVDEVDQSNNPIETYAFGVAVHQNMLSKALYEAVIDGFLCLDFDPVDGEAELQRTIGDILTTDLFGFFIPYLSDTYPGMDMAVRLIPLLQDPKGRQYNPNFDATYGSKISAYVEQYLNSGDPLTGTTRQNLNTEANPIPRIHTGGIAQYDNLKKRFRGEISTLTLRNFWPDLSIVIPHLLAEFYVWDDSGGAPVRKRAFALDIGLNVGLNIDILMDAKLTTGPALTQTVTPLEDDTDAYGRFPLDRPTYSGTDFPIGCVRQSVDPTFPYPCEVTGVPSRWVLFLGGLLDPELNAVLTYDEMADAVTDFAGVISNVSQTADPTGAGDPTTGFTAYEDAISNLIGLLLSGEISAFAEIGIDLAALINLPVVVSVPYIGPSLVWNDSNSTADGEGLTPLAAGDLNDQVECGADGVADECEDPIWDTTGAFETTRDVSDGDMNGFGDYLVVAAGLDLSYISSNYLLRFVDSFVEPLGLVGYEYCDGALAGGETTAFWGGVTNISCISDNFNNALSDLLGGIGGAPGAAYNTGQGFPQGYVAPETIVKGVRKAHALETLIDFEGWHPNLPADQLAFSYRVDGGLWTPFVPASTARIPGLLEGRHVVEIRAKDPQGNVEYTPERVEFVVDSVGPKLSIVGDRVQSGTATFLVDSRDAQTLPEDVRISWRLDDGAWSEYSYRKEIAFDAAPGQHVLQVRALDEAGNVGTSTLTVAVDEGGFGCAVAPAGDHSGLLDLLVILLVPGLLVAIRRRS